MFLDRISPNVSLFREDGLSTVTVPETLDSVDGRGLVIRGASVELLALLEAGELDYAFEYESVINQHGLKLLTLPEELNLGNESIDYSGVEVKLDFQRFASIEPVFKGEQIGYGITIPTNAEHPKEAEQYLEFLFGPEGREIMRQNSQLIFDNPSGHDFDKIPENLRNDCVSDQE